jgi:hypothetical protein
MSYAIRCETCPGEPPPESSAQWSITVEGPAIITWSCDKHLSEILRRLITDLDSDVFIVKKRVIE